MIDLPSNYRPPSRYGVRIPISRNVYNADPATLSPAALLADEHQSSKGTMAPGSKAASLSKGMGGYAVSAGTVVLDACRGASVKADCDCPAQSMKGTSSNTDQWASIRPNCMRRVMAVQFGAEFVPILRIADGRGTELQLHRERQLSQLRYTLNERNGRTDYCTNASAIQGHCTDKEAVKMAELDPQAFDAISWEGGGLYHFDVQVIEHTATASTYSDPGANLVTRCPRILSAELVLWVDKLPMQPLDQVAVMATTAGVGITVIFFVYVDFHRRR
eukprot:SAG31_NODE_5683_length_2383_cov_1.339755_2_plen_275_part_00